MLGPLGLLVMYSRTPRVLPVSLPPSNARKRKEVIFRSTEFSVGVLQALWRVYGPPGYK
jgi:hypothetical protein